MYMHASFCLSNFNICLSLEKILNNLFPKLQIDDKNVEFCYSK